MSSPIETGSSEDATSINIRDDTDNSQWITTGMISDGSITAQSKYDGTNVRATKTIYYASHKLLDDLDDPTTYSWAVSDDADTVAQLANGWLKLLVLLILKLQLQKVLLVLLMILLV